MRLPANRTAIYIFWCRLYILLGVCSISVGLYLWWIAQSIGSDSKKSLLAIVAILILVGLLRIANSLWVLRNIYRRSEKGKLTVLKSTIPDGKQDRPSS